jgi:hypothetical protein
VSTPYCRAQGLAGIGHSHGGVSYTLRFVFQRIVDSANSKLGLGPGHPTRGIRGTLIRLKSCPKRDSKNCFELTS